MTSHKVKGKEASQVPQGPCGDTLVPGGTSMEWITWLLLSLFVIWPVWS